MDDSTMASLCLLKMIEYLVTSVWIYLVGSEHEAIKPRRWHVSERERVGSPSVGGGEEGLPGHHDTWWNISLPQVNRTVWDVESHLVGSDW
jgi:hypothetical protein